MRRWDYPVAPMAETQLRRAMQMTWSDPSVFFENPGSATLLSLAAIALLAPFAVKGLSRLRVAEDWRGASQGSRAACPRIP